MSNSTNIRPSDFMSTVLNQDEEGEQQQSRRYNIPIATLIDNGPEALDNSHQTRANEPGDRPPSRGGRRGSRSSQARRRTAPYQIPNETQQRTGHSSQPEGSRGHDNTQGYHQSASAEILGHSTEHGVTHRSVSYSNTSGWPIMGRSGQENVSSSEAQLTSKSRPGDIPNSNQNALLSNLAAGLPSSGLSGYPNIPADNKARLSPNIPRDQNGNIAVPEGPGWRWITDLLGQVESYLPQDLPQILPPPAQHLLEEIPQEVRRHWRWEGQNWTDELKQSVWSYGPNDKNDRVPHRPRAMESGECERLETHLHRLRFAIINQRRYEYRGREVPRLDLDSRERQDIESAIKALKARGNDKDRVHDDFGKAICRKHPDITEEEVCDMRKNARLWRNRWQQAKSKFGGRPVGMIDYKFGNDCINGLAWILTAIDEGY